MSNTLIARIFVTSYAIGNNDGFGVGKWFDLEDYSEKSAFIEAATDYVKNDLGESRISLSSMNPAVLTPCRPWTTCHSRSRPANSSAWLVNPAPENQRWGWPSQ